MNALIAKKTSKKKNHRRCTTPKTQAMSIIHSQNTIWIRRCLIFQKGGKKQNQHESFEGQKKIKIYTYRGHVLIDDRCLAMMEERGKRKKATGFGSTAALGAHRLLCEWVLRGP
jgi:hypothetical protein